MTAYEHQLTTRPSPLPEYGVTRTVSSTPPDSTWLPSSRLRSAAITRASHPLSFENSSTWRVPPGDVSGWAK